MLRHRPLCRHLQHERHEHPPTGQPDDQQRHLPPPLIAEVPRQHRDQLHRVPDDVVGRQVLLQAQVREAVRVGRVLQQHPRPPPEPAQELPGRQRPAQLALQPGQGPRQEVRELCRREIVPPARVVQRVRHRPQERQRVVRVLEQRLDPLGRRPARQQHPQALCVEPHPAPRDLPAPQHHQAQERQQQRRRHELQEPAGRVGLPAQLRDQRVRPPRRVRVHPVPPLGVRQARPEHRAVP